MPPSRRSAGNAGPPTAQDVAVAAGVSTATVSRAFNNPEKVAPEVRARVLATASALGWMPHAAGSALARGRTNIAGAIIPTLDNEIFAAQIGGMQSAFAARSVTLLLGCSNYDRDEAFRHAQAMLGKGVEALAIAGEAHRPELFETISLRAACLMSSHIHTARTARIPASASTTAPLSIA